MMAVEWVQFQACPSCQSLEVKVVQTARRCNGSRWRRHRCTNCDHRWSTQQPEVFEPTPPQKSAQRSSYETRRLTDRQAAYIILSGETDSDLSKRFGISRRSVQTIRNGTSYRNVYHIISQLQPDEIEEAID